MPNTTSKISSYSPRNVSSMSGAIGCPAKLLKPEPSLVRKLLLEEKDERYRYLVRHGLLHYVEKDSMTLLVELKQIPHIWIVYRRPSEREANPDKMILDGR
jgi:leucine-rich repeat-containing protein 49